MPTQFQVLSRKLPFWVILKIFEVDVNVIVVIWPHHLNHLKLWLIFGTLFEDTKGVYILLLCVFVLYEYCKAKHTFFFTKYTSTMITTVRAKSKSALQTFRILSGPLSSSKGSEKGRSENSVKWEASKQLHWGILYNDVNSPLPLEAWGESRGGIENFVLHVVSSELVTQNFK